MGKSQKPNTRLVDHHVYPHLHWGRGKSRRQIQAGITVEEYLEWQNLLEIRYIAVYRGGRKLHKDTRLQRGEQVQLEELI